MCNVHPTKNVHTYMQHTCMHWSKLQNVYTFPGRVCTLLVCITSMPGTTSIHVITYARIVGLFITLYVLTYNELYALHGLVILQYLSTEWHTFPNETCTCKKHTKQKHIKIVLSKYVSHAYY